MCSLLSPAFKFYTNAVIRELEYIATASTTNQSIFCIEVQAQEEIRGRARLTPVAGCTYGDRSTASNRLISTLCGLCSFDFRWPEQSELYWQVLTLRLVSDMLQDFHRLLLAIEEYKSGFLGFSKGHSY